MKRELNTSSQQEKADLLYQLHHSGKLLILPNVWDSLGAMLLQDLGYTAIATASAAVAFTNGYDDGEHISFRELLVVLKKIEGSVIVPVTADIETGYAENDLQLKDNILQLLDTGIAGINIEDTDKQTGSLRPLKEQCNRIRLIKDTCAETGSELFINARTDVYLWNSIENKLEETIQRGLAYKDAGADCFYPILMHKADEIKGVVNVLFTWPSIT
jgi:2-methylisocitrate lyase-like PEP mutase family enzyme